MDPNQDGTGQPNQDGQNGNDPKPAGRYFTEDEINAIVERRLAKDRKSRPDVIAKSAKELLLERVGIDFDNEDEINAIRNSLEKKDKTQTELNKIKREHARAEEEKKKILDDYNAMKSQVHSQLIETEILKHSANAFKPEQVVRLLKSNFLVEDGKVFVRGEDGNASHSKSIADEVKSFFDDNPNLVRSSTPTGGAGSKPTESGSNGDSGKVSLLKPEERKRLMREAMASSDPDAYLAAFRKSHGL